MTQITIFSRIFLHAQSSHKRLALANTACLCSCCCVRERTCGVLSVMSWRSSTLPLASAVVHAIFMAHEHQIWCSLQRRKQRLEISLDHLETFTRAGQSFNYVCPAKSWSVFGLFWSRFRVNERSTLIKNKNRWSHTNHRYLIPNQIETWANRNSAPSSLERDI